MKNNKTAFLIFLVVIFKATVCSIQPAAGLQLQKAGSENIRLNQIGFYPAAIKIAIVIKSSSSTFAIRTIQGKQVFQGHLKSSVNAGFNGDHTLIADFTSLKKPGHYLLTVPGSGTSYPFNINASVHHEVSKGAIKAFYFMRASIPIKKQYAGKWNRAEGHPDNAVLIHPSAVTAKRPAGTVISAPGGWYDAGDYNKYIVNSGISTGTLLLLYEDFPAHMKKVGLNIPESGNGVPDILNEALWNIRWMLSMQDPNDGGVYNKLTNAAFDKFEMPDKSTEPRYVVQKGTAATLDFAAVMAQASRIYRQFSLRYPGLADSCLKQAKLAWKWARENPEIVYDQNSMNKKFSPQITTGGYGDNNFSDEFIWAAAELFVTTHDKSFLTGINLLPDNQMPLPGWNQVKLLGYYTLLKHSDGVKELPEIKRRMLDFADELISGASETAYETVMNKNRQNFGWGSNSVAANQGVALLQVYLLTKDQKYLTFALSNLDYLLGRNATGYCYVTGYGSKSPMHPHHRPSATDGVVEPIPGLLVGGPNPGMQDGIKVPSIVPDEAYIDDERAYAANEIAINWNAPFAYLSNAIEALESQLEQ